jgi:hypothetical protein
MEIKDLNTRIQTLEKRQRWTNAAVALLVLIAVAWPIALAALAVLHPGSIPGLKWLTDNASSSPDSATTQPSDTLATSGTNGTDGRQ